MSKYHLPDNIDTRQSIIAVRNLRFPEGGVWWYHFPVAIFDFAVLHNKIYT
jgi:hypothetical protein